MDLPQDSVKYERSVHSRSHSPASTRTAEWRTLLGREKRANRRTSRVNRSEGVKLI